MIEPSQEVREQAAAIVNHASGSDLYWLRDAIVRALAEKDAEVTRRQMGLELWREDYRRVHEKWQEEQALIAALAADLATMRGALERIAAWPAGDALFAIGEMRAIAATALAAPGAAWLDREMNPIWSWQWGVQAP